MYKLQVNIILNYVNVNNSTKIQNCIQSKFNYRGMCVCIY